MIKFENTEVFGWEATIRGMRNSMNSWERSDTDFKCGIVVSPNDLDLMKRLVVGSPVHAKYLRMITVYVDITAPLYWWKEFDTYKVGTVANSCSTMHKISEKEFELGDFSTEHLTYLSLDGFTSFIKYLNALRERYNLEKNKEDWWEIIQLLPSSYNQKRTVMLNYEVLANIYKSRKNHKLDEWSENIEIVAGKEMSNNDFMPGFCDWIKTLPYSELIVGDKDDD